MVPFKVASEYKEVAGLSGVVAGRPILGKDEKQATEAGTCKHAAWKCDDGVEEVLSDQSRPDVFGRRKLCPVLIYDDGGQSGVVEVAERNLDPGVGCFTTRVPEDPTRVATADFIDTDPEWWFCDHKVGTHVREGVVAKAVAVLDGPGSGLGGGRER